MARKKLFFIFLTIAILGTHLSNIWRLRTYPFTDLPNHLAEAYLLRTLTLNPDDSLGSYYRIDIAPYTPASLHAVFCALFPDVEIGNKVFYTLCMLLIVGSLVVLIRAAGGDSWLAFLSTLFFYHLSAMWGLVGYIAGVATVLFVMVMLVRYLDRPSFWSALWLALATLCVYYAHAIAWLFMVACIGSAILTRRGMEPKYRWLGLAVIFPGLTLFSLWVMRAEGFENYPPTIPFIISYYRSEYLVSLPRRLIDIFLYDNNYIATGQLGNILSLLFTVPVVVWLGWMIYRWRATSWGLANSSSRHCGLVFLIVSAVCYLILPNRLPDQFMLFERMSVFFFLGAIWTLGYLITKPLHSLMYAMFLPLLILHAGLWFNFFDDFNRMVQPFQSLLYRASIAQNRTLGAIIEDYNFRGEPALIHYQNYQLIWNHAAVPTNIVEYRYRLVTAQPGQTLPHYEGWITGPADIDILLDHYRNLELLLCHGEYACKASLETGRYTFAGQRDGWILWISSHE